MNSVFTLPRPATARVLAVGAWLKNTACRLDGATVHWSALHGDLGDPANCLALEQSIAQLAVLGPIDAVAHDLHPDFHSTHLALAQELGVPAQAVQHHHAHIAVVQAEQRLDEPVIGLALDGVGLGTDSSAWGGELLWSHGARWRRVGHLSSLVLPGGDVAAREPWRMAAAVLHALGRGDEIVARFAEPLCHAGATLMRSMLQRGVNCPPKSSAGRWFDAAAGALGLSVRQAFEAEATIALERQARDWLAQHEVEGDDGLTPIRPDSQLDLYPLLERLFAMSDLGRSDAVAQGAALFHANLADALARWALGAARTCNVGIIALGGGCFLNQVLTQRLVATLRRSDLRVLQPQAVNCGDAGLALGQAWVAAHQVHQGAAPSVHSSPFNPSELSPCV
ncbi:Kae1-like domain-containing protein [Cupriavidus taiwanensis]|uniref:Hydrogenase maturation protein hypF1 n=1 Tax=Cupriavidus taiwanensis TaxID=164546 RepID=A0A375JC76_9BURK|nr:carbamoyltransferase HypF [Cupriavidus taiwanensis]SPS02382.1 Hydrogenase maturation protein hypF1 [Cupriavidus taiwanensis]